jgi:glycosyltransferase involved in cell wall biosynthesis
MKKIKVLFLPSDRFGVGHFRAIWPAQEIQKNHSDEFEIDIKINVPVLEDDLGKYDIIHFHRRINTEDETVAWIKKFQDAGAIVVADIDDFWTPFKEHPAYSIVIKKGINLKIIQVCKAADYVTTTTELYAAHLRQKVNPNVHIIPNAIDESLPMWQNNNVESDRIRVGWIGGSSHAKDLEKLHNCFNILFNDPDIKDKIQVVMCGYDTRGTVTTIDPRTNKEVVRKIRPDESVWNKFEAIFNDSGRALPGQYVRRNTLPITQYGKHYNHVDICLAPLAENTFNECKSELKLIETGMMKKCLIASDLYVYKELLTHGENGLLVDPRKNHKLWSKYIKQLILEDELRNKLSESLYKLVYPRYTLTNITNERCDWYKKLLSGSE